MTYDELTPTMRMFLGNREMIRRLGFSADDIFFSTARSVRNGGRLSCFLAIRTQGREFSIECGPVESVEACEVEYKRATEAVNSHALGDPDYFRMFAECEAYRDTGGLIDALRRKGFHVRIAQPTKTLRPVS